jgi:hypothetical protein
MIRKLQNYLDQPDDYSAGTSAPTVAQTIAAGPSPMAVPLPNTVTASNPALNNSVAAVNQVLGDYADWDDEDPDTTGFYYDDENIFETGGIVNSDPGYFRRGSNQLLHRKRKFEIEKTLRANGIIDGAAFGLPGVKFKKLDTYAGPSHIEYYDEVFPEELSSFALPLVGALLSGKKGKARRQERKAKRVARRDARKDAKAARKQARVDRKNRRVGIREYKAETKRMKVENGEPSALDNILDTVATTFGPQQDLPIDGELNPETEINPADYSNGDLAQGYKPFTLDADASGRAIQAGGNKSLVYILIGLAVLGAAIYFVTKNKN